MTIDELYSINRLSANLKVSPVVLRLFMSFTQLSEFPTLLAIPKVGPVLLPFRHRVIKILKGTWALVLSVQGSKIIEGSFRFLSGWLQQEGNCTANQRLRHFYLTLFSATWRGWSGLILLGQSLLELRTFYHHPALGQCLLRTRNREARA